MSRFIVVACSLVAACGETLPVSTDAAPPADAATPVPMISEALAEECGDYTPGSGVGAGDDLHKVTLADPDAVCNDGTPAVMYVRPAATGAEAARWLFYLQGGGSCGTHEGCTIRYCGTEKYTKAKMSSTWTPLRANTDGQGILDRDGVNPFADANLVLVYYCSSDGWTGQKSDTVLVDDVDPSLEFRLHFRGHTIIEAVLDQLLAGPVTSEDGMVTMPSLADANVVLWAGTSAGGNGAEQHLDYVAGRLAGNGTAVRGVFDANLPPLASDLGDPVDEAAIEAFERDYAWPVVQVAAYDAFVDQSCLDLHDTADAWRCGQNQHVVLEHVTTPFFLRQDLRDRTVGTLYLENGVSIDQLAGAYRATAVRVPDIAAAAEEGASVTVAPGVYAPNCGQHVALTNEDWFAGGTVETTGGTALTFRAALGAWLLGNPVVAIDTHPSTVSYCPPPIDNGE